MSIFKRKFRPVFAVLLILAVVLGACGGGDNPDTPTATAPSTDFFIPENNLALNQQYLGSDTFSDNSTAAMAFDGDKETMWSPKDGENTFVEVDFSGDVTFNTINMYITGTPDYYIFEAYSNGAWVSLHETYEQFGGDMKTLTQKTYMFSDITANKLKVTVNSGHINVAEIEVYRQPAENLNITYNPNNNYLPGNFYTLQSDWNIAPLLLGGIFPENKTAPYAGGWQFTANSTGVGFDSSLWDKTLDERKVFQTELSHTETEADSWKIRLGLGGQIYSVTGAYGQAIPPQGYKLEWNDAVFQLTAVPYTQNNADQPETQDFLQQGGSYLHGYDLPGSTYYSPLLSYNYDQANNSYTMLNWMQQSQIPSVNTSGLLCYTKVRDIGSGVAEITYVLYNYGDTVIDDISAPWGGIRESVLPMHVISTPEGKYRDITGTWSQVEALKNTGGWAASCVNSDDPSKPALGLVFGNNSVTAVNDRAQWDDMLYSYGDAGNDNFVQNVNVRFKIQPGDVFYYRFYMISDTLAGVQQKANELAGKVDYGFIKYNEATADQIPYNMYYDTETQQTRITYSTSGNPVFYTYAEPIPGSKPLFLMRDKDGKYVLSTDPYILCGKTPYVNPYPTDDPKYALYNNKTLYTINDGDTQFAALLGYVMTGNEISSEYPYKALGDVLTDRTFYPNTGADDPKIAVRIEPRPSVTDGGAVG